MLFNSYTFFAFLVLFAAVYLPARRLSNTASKAVLLAFSYVFYGWAVPSYVALVVVTTLTDFFCARRIDAAVSPRARRRWLLFTISLNLGLLAYFKYANFFIGTFEGLLGSDVLPGIAVILPVGISFYTFESLSYTIDVYRRRLPAERNFLDYALFIGFFPHLVAGPIVLAHNFLGQLKSRPKVTADSAVSGLFTVIFGFFLKAVVADRLAPGVDAFFAAPGAATRWEAWLDLYSYAFQIFGDFAGYSAIAIGLARMMGYRLPRNFDYPYFSASITEFWRRWHMSLSAWLREYLYISLGGNRRGSARTYANLMITMLLGGLWHGASWNFVVWGGLHGLALAVEKAIGARRPGRLNGGTGARRIVRAIVVFHLVCLLWVFFRAPTWSASLAVFKALIFGGEGSGEGVGAGVGNSQGLALVLAAGVYAGAALRKHMDTLPRFKPMRGYADAVLAAVCLYFILALGVSAEAFIYFQF